MTVSKEEKEIIVSKSEDGEIKANVAVEWLPRDDTKGSVQETLLLHAHNSIFPLHRHFSPLLALGLFTPASFRDRLRRPPRLSLCHATLRDRTTKAGLCIFFCNSHRIRQALSRIRIVFQFFHCYNPHFRVQSH